jgi:hypothetical protein
MTLPRDVGNAEMLGRGIFESDKAKAATKGKVPPKVFREKTGVREISVDRLSFGDEEIIASLHKNARSGQTFYGWAVVLSAHACELARTVIARPIPTNKWHAEITLPPLTPGQELEEQKQHSLNLANHATWRASP